jgi:hypothetical protein
VRTRQVRQRTIQTPALRALQLKNKCFDIIADQNNNAMINDVRDEKPELTCSAYQCGARP